MSRTDFETEIIIMEDVVFIEFLMQQKLLNEQFICEFCRNNLIMCNYLKVSDGSAWHCLISGCVGYKKS